MEQTRVNPGEDNNKPKTRLSNNGNQRLQDKPSTSKQHKNASPARSKDHHQEDNSCLNPIRKQSVRTKVREKALIWRQTLANKTRVEDYESQNALPRLSQMDIQGNQKQEEDPWASSIPANPSSIWTCTDLPRREQCQYPPTSTTSHQPKSLASQRSVGFIVEDANTPTFSPMRNAATEVNSTDHTKTLAEAVTEKLVPSYYDMIYRPPTMKRTCSSVHEMYLSKPLTVTPSTSEDDNNVIDEDVAFGVYGESEEMELEGDERALWEVIRNAIQSPTMDIGDMGVMQKVKEVVTGLLQEEEEEDEKRKEDQEQEDKTEQQDQQLLLQTNSTMQNTRSSSPLIPISTNAYEGEEESQKRILQTN